MSRLARVARLAAAMGLACLSCGVVRAEEVAKAAIPSIGVEGSASRELAPDMAIIAIGVTTERPTASEAAALNGRTAAALLAEAKAADVPEKDLQTTQVSLSPVYQTDRATSPSIKSFRASNRISITIHNLDSVGSLIGRLLAKGANDLEGVDYGLADTAPALDGLRADAVHDAQRKARIYAEAAGVKLGRVLDIAPESASPVPVFRQFKTAMAAAPAPEPAPVAPGLIKLESRVTVTWELLQ